MEELFFKFLLSTTDEMIAELVAESLWCGADDPRKEKVDAFTAKLTQYLKSGKGDIVALENELKSCTSEALWFLKLPQCRNVANLREKLIYQVFRLLKT